MNDKNSEPNPPGEPDAEKLIRSLEFELSQQRAARELGGGNRTLFRVLSLAIILGGAMLALYILSAMLADLPRPAHSASPAASAMP